MATKTKKTKESELQVHDIEMFDDCFTVDQNRSGTWESFDKEGKGLLTSLTKEICVASTRAYLKQMQEGGFTDEVTHEGTVGGKL